MYADNMTGQYYVDDDYILYQHIEYEKCYKWLEAREND
jgi:hypothetical protein